MIISGLIDSRSSKGVKKMPGLGDIPVLGELFKSRAFVNEETDLVIFLTPTIIDPEHRINQDALRRVADMKKRADKNLRFSLMD
jgi:pilus assembly protein CpaC